MLWSLLHRSIHALSPFFCPDDLALLRRQIAGLEGMYRDLLGHVGLEASHMMPQPSQPSSLTSAASRLMQHVGHRERKMR